MRRLVNKGSLTGLKNPTPSLKALLFVVVLLLATLVVAPFYLSRIDKTPDGHRVWGLITTHDLPNFVPMMEQFDKVLRSGDFYPRWNPDFNLGYGTATANFYPPGTFYLTSLINAVVNNWPITLFILSALSLAASCLAFYALARTFYSKSASAAAALFYAVLPYHQLDLYWRGAIPEFTGFAFLPVILYFAFKLGSEGRLRYYAAVGLCQGVYLMTHLPVGYLFTYVLAFYAVIWAVRARDLKIALRIAGGVALSLLVSAIYWLPAALEGKYIYEWASDIFPYHENYVGMLPVHDSFNQQIQDVFDCNALALIATIVILRALSKSSISHSEQPVLESGGTKPDSSQSQTKIWIILAILMPFMSTPFSMHLSKLIPKIQIAVPPFRWLAMSCMFTSLLVAASIDLLRQQRGLRPKRELAYKLSLGAVVVLNLWLTGYGIVLGALAKPTYSPSASFTDAGFTPKDSTRPAKMPDTAAVVITPEGGASEVLQWLPTHREIAVRVDQPSELRIKTYNFPGWTARIDGKVVPMLSDKDGVQQIDVPSGIHNVQASFENTPPRTAGTALSAVGLLIILGLSSADRLRKRSVKTERRDE
jgi:4-amino-4-deoxy-L-arabinose transferase-like glycosyltransferase